MGNCTTSADLPKEDGAHAFAGSMPVPRLKTNPANRRDFSRDKAQQQPHHPSPPSALQEQSKKSDNQGIRKVNFQPLCLSYNFDSESPPYQLEDINLVPIVKPMNAQSEDDDNWEELFYEIQQKDYMQNLKEIQRQLIRERSMWKVKEREFHTKRRKSIFENIFS